MADADQNGWKKSIHCPKALICNGFCAIQSWQQIHKPLTDDANLLGVNMTGNTLFNFKILPVLKCNVHHTIFCDPENNNFTFFLTLFVKCWAGSSCPLKPAQYLMNNLKNNW